MKNYRNNTEKIDYVITKIAELNSEIAIEDIVASLAFEPEMMVCLNLTDELKDLISTISKEDVRKEIVKFALKASQIGVKAGYIADQVSCVDFYCGLLDKKIKPKEIIEYLYQNDRSIMSVIDSYVKTRFQYKSKIDLEMLDRFTNLKIARYLDFLSNGKTLDSGLRIKKLKIFERNINKSKNDILNGSQLRKENVNYSLGTNMFASSDIGNFKSTQEDSVLLLTHPKNNKFKMLVVADGLGSKPNAGKASRYVCQMMLKWFEKLDKDFYQKHFKNLVEEFNDKLVRVNKRLCEFEDGRSTTFVGAIVGKEKTIIISVGDSRAYISKNGSLTQVSRDDSLVQEYLENGEIKDKNDARFHIHANKITKCLGIKDKDLQFYSNMYVINNDDYDKLLLVSGGITDCLSDNQIMVITSNTPRDKIAQKID